MLRIELDHDKPYSSNACYSVSNNMYITLLLIYLDSSNQTCTYYSMNLVRIFITVLLHVEQGNVNS